jgi:hypothetical protein
MMKTAGLGRFGGRWIAATNLVNPPHLKQTVSVYRLHVHLNFPYPFNINGLQVGPNKEPFPIQVSVHTTQ